MSHAAVAVPHAEPVSLPETHPWARVPLVGGIVAVVGLLGSAALYGGAREQFFFSWLVAFVYFLTIALGCLYFVLIHSATQSGWGVVVRRLGETAAATLPLFALLFVPVALGMQTLFPWSREALVASDHLLQWKHPFLNTSFFYLRAAVYFAVWSALALWCYALSCRQDAAADASLAARLRKWSAPALIPLVLTQSLAGVDWLMSLDPHWYSTIFGVYVFAGAFMSAFAFLVLVCVGLQATGVLRNAITVEHYHDLGKMLFAFTVFWAYIGFSQFFLIWYGNIPEETLWYKHRLHGSWTAVSLLLAVGHFGIPFFFLMSRTIKRNKTTLAMGAAWMLLMHLVDVHWMVMPALHAEGIHLTPLDITTFFAVGGAFVAAFGWLLRRHPLLPVGDPRLPESLTFENTF
jgi:hypothetical protein